MSDFPRGLDVGSKKEKLCAWSHFKLFWNDNLAIGRVLTGTPRGRGHAQNPPFTPRDWLRTHGLPKGRPLEKEWVLNISYSQRRSSFMSGLVISQARMWLSRPLFSPPSPDSSLVFSDMTEGENKKTAWPRLTLPFPPKAHGQPTADPGRRRKRGWNWNSDGRVKH